MKNNEQHIHTICFLIGHDWPEECIPGTDDDGEWPKFICKFCEGIIDIPRWDGIPEGFILEKLWYLKTWACGYLLGHDWASTQYGEDGEWSSACERCGIDGEQAPDEESCNIWIRAKNWFQEYEWPWIS